MATSHSSVRISTRSSVENPLTTTEVHAFIAEAHRRLGADGPMSFSIVLFGEPTAYPHGVPYSQTLADGDMVLAYAKSILRLHDELLSRLSSPEVQGHVVLAEHQGIIPGFDSNLVFAPRDGAGVVAMVTGAPVNSWLDRSTPTASIVPSGDT